MIKRSDLPEDQLRNRRLKKQVDESRFYVKLQWVKFVAEPIFDVICTQCGACLTHLVKSDTVEKIERANQMHECRIR